MNNRVLTGLHSTGLSAVVFLGFLIRINCTSQNDLYHEHSIFQIRNWKVISADELKCFCRIPLAMGPVELPKFQVYRSLEIQFTLYRGLQILFNKESSLKFRHVYILLVTPKNMHEIALTTNFTICLERLVF